MKKHKTLWLLILGFLVMAVSIAVLSSSAVIGAMSGVFMAVIGAYTALDLKAIVKKTGTMPQGKYEPAERWKYFLGMFFLGLVFMICLVKQKTSGLNLELSFGFLGPGILAIIGFVISGMKMNKSATLDGPVFQSHSHQINPTGAG